MTEAPNKPTEILTRPRLTAGVWIGLSVLWFFLGWRRVMQHDKFGWFLCGTWVVVGVLWSYRLFRFWRRTNS